MGYKDKMGEGLDVKGSFTFTQVSSAVKNVCDAMGEKAVKVNAQDEESGIIELYLFDTGFRKVAGKSLFGTIASAISKDPDLIADLVFETANDTKSSLSINVSSAATTSSSVMFIPAGTTVHGITTYRDFLTHLTSELKRIDQNAEIIRRGKE
ncbi:MAG: hypothetical protein LBP91_00045 [Coriobacteriales bacterium]|jgi:hypothetical protein|nr:hypothetical protein [Coriobacteriales bacterium]